MKKDTERIFIICAIAPIISIVIASLLIISFTIGWKELIPAVNVYTFTLFGAVVYAFMMPITLLLLFSIHALFRTVKLSIITRFMLVALMGCLGGVLMDTFVISRQQITLDYFTNPSALPLLLFGLLVAIVSFVLYSFGPIKVLQSDKSH